MVSLCVYKLCSLCKHLSHSHTKLYEMSRKCHHGNSTIYLKCFTCHSHPLVNHNEHMLSCWFEVSCHQVMLSVFCKVLYTRVHSLTHLTFFSKICWPNHPPSTEPPLSYTAQSQPSATNLIITLWVPSVKDLLKQKVLQTHVLVCVLCYLSNRSIRLQIHKHLNGKITEK